MSIHLWQLFLLLWLVFSAYLIHRCNTLHDENTRLCLLVRRQMIEIAALEKLADPVPLPVRRDAVEMAERIADGADADAEMAAFVGKYDLAKVMKQKPAPPPRESLHDCGVPR